MNSPLISVIVPVYKVERFLDICVTSIVNQSYWNLEIILVDDGSPDRCGEICDMWARMDNRIHVIHQKNKGLSAARNAGLDTARGEYIGFVDSDDYIAAEMYAVCLDAILRTGKKIAICCHERVDEKSNCLISKVKHEEKLYNTEEAVNAVFLRECEQSVWSKLYHKSLFEGIRFPVGETNEDLPLVVPLFVKSGGAVHTGRILYAYRSVAESITQNYWQKDYIFVWKHLSEIGNQLKKFHLERCSTSFDHLVAVSCFKIALQLDKNYSRLSKNAKKESRLFRNVLRRKIGLFLRSDLITPKDKLLYMMIISRTLRPIYKLVGKELH